VTKTKLCYRLPSLENLNQEPRDRNKIIFMSFHLFHTKRMRHGYACAEGRDAKLLLMPSCFVKLLETIFFYIFLKLDGCQAKIENCLSCCYTLSEPY
jgi:hypothetical protein